LGPALLGTIAHEPQVDKVGKTTKIHVNGRVNGSIGRMDKGADLYQQLAKVVDEHQYISGNCPCGAPGIWFWSDYREHLAQVIGDLLIDLAGTGQLLASIDRDLNG
jgi:hypothetical protein